MTDVAPPGQQYLSAERVLHELGAHGARRLRTLTTPRVLVLGVIGGAFVTTGAMFSVLLATGTDNPGVERLLEGLGFSAGFFFVILAGAALFTEANVVMPATALRREPGTTASRIARFWGLAVVGNFIGALLVGYALHLAQHYPPMSKRSWTASSRASSPTARSAAPGRGSRSCSRGSSPTGW